ncbi:MAG: ankyrin repeat domain-containing protein [Aestuariivita sp.]|nr:ankyrin repeat domain-containing protein [Aestuariivita sp.]
MHNSDAVVAILLAAGADIHARNDPEFTPFELAVKNGNLRAEMRERLKP